MRKKTLGSQHNLRGGKEWNRGRSRGGLGGAVIERPKSMHTDMAVSRITMKSLAKFGFCLTILLTSVAGEWLISALILWGMGGGERENVLLVNI